MTAITLKAIGKSYGSTVAVRSVDLTINSGDLFFLLGPSGCGKTTLLRMIAGFINPTRGRIFFGDRDVTNVAPNRRETGMVFQSYALWPHMSVAENVAFGLRIRKVSRVERERRVMAALEMVRMAPYAERKPNQLSGGQQQRVALARALAVEPTVLLLDEPLSNLDAKLRLEMRGEIRRICSELGITTVYVTHDQKEALSLADDMVVLRDGEIVQRGRPREIYQRPASRFVADFIGETNFLPGSVESIDGSLAVIDTPAGRLRSSDLRRAWRTGDRVTVSIRPESFRRVMPGHAAAPAGGDTPTSARPMHLRGRRSASVYLGELAQHVIDVGSASEAAAGPNGQGTVAAPTSAIRVIEVNPLPFGDPGEIVDLDVSPDDVVLLEPA